MSSTAAVRSALVIVLLALVTTPAHALFVNTTEAVPVERLVRNLSRRVEARPRDAHAHYVLARVHSMAWARVRDTVPVEPAKGADGVVGFGQWQSVREKRTQAQLSDADRMHFYLSVIHYRRAVEHGPKKAIHHLGLAWMLDSGTGWLDGLRMPDGGEPKTAVPDEERTRYRKLLEVMATGEFTERTAARRELVSALPRPLVVVLVELERPQKKDPALRDAATAILRRYWQDLALASYRRAYELSIAADLKRDSIGMEGDDAISLEAGRAILRLLADHVETHEIAAERRRVEKAIGKLAEKPMWITPMLFPLGADVPLRELLPSGRTASIDLDGDGVPGHWPWVGSDAGLLVWAPDGDDGPLENGRRLFGSVTWWIAWRDGYEPLDALDDDGDGRLRGGELDGIAVWRDLNGDARAGPGEVVPLPEFGVVSLATQPDTRHDGVPAHTRGITLRDGSTRPTYDWTPRRLTGP